MGTAWNNLENSFVLIVRISKLPESLSGPLKAESRSMVCVVSSDARGLEKTPAISRASKHDMRFVVIPTVPPCAGCPHENASSVSVASVMPSEALTEVFALPGLDESLEPPKDIPHPSPMAPWRVGRTTFDRLQRPRFMTLWEGRRSQFGMQQVTRPTLTRSQLRRSPREASHKINYAEQGYQYQNAMCVPSLAGVTIRQKIWLKPST